MRGDWFGAPGCVALGASTVWIGRSNPPGSWNRGDAAITSGQVCFIVADIVVLDLRSTSEIRQIAERSYDILDLIFPTIMTGSDPGVRDTWIVINK